MNIAIRTAGNNGKGLKKMLQENSCYSDVNVAAFIDSSTKLMGKEHEGTPILSPFSAYEWYAEKKIDKVVIPCEFHTIAMEDRFMIERFYKELKEIGVSDDDILISNLLFVQSKTGDCNDFETDFVKYENFFHIRYMEFSAAFHCNLNCKGCSHFSPLIKEEFPVFEEVKRDFVRLKQLIPMIHRIRILGGEPLLNPEIKKYIELVKEVYPYTDLRIVTNGILIRSLDKDTLKCIQDNKVKIDITVYKPVRGQYENILASLKDYNIDVFMYNCYEFVPTLRKDREEFPYNATEKICMYRNLAHGCISTCMLLHDIKYFNEYFNTDYPQEDGLINIHDPNLTSSELTKRLKEKHALCDYCATYKHMSPALSVIHHDEIQVGWDRYKNGDEPRKEDWFGRN